MVCQGKSFGKFRKESLGTGISMRLEYTPDFFMWIILCSVESCLDFCWMMCIIINDRDSADLSLVLESSVCSGKALKSLKNNIIRKIKELSAGNGGQCVGNIVDSRNFERAGSDWTAVMEYTEGSVSEFIISDIVGSVICFFLQTVGDDLTWKLLYDLLVFRSVGIDDQCAVCRKKLSKSAERMTDVINILKEIQMISIYIEDNTDLWEKA